MIFLLKFMRERVRNCPQFIFIYLNNICGPQRCGNNLYEIYLYNNQSLFIFFRLNELYLAGTQKFSRV